MRFIIWMANFINSNLKEIEIEERFYELDTTVQGEVLVRSSVTQKEMLAMKNSTLLATVITPSISEIHPFFACGSPDGKQDNCIYYHIY